MKACFANVKAPPLRTRMAKSPATPRLVKAMRTMCETMPWSIDASPGGQEFPACELDRTPTPSAFWYGWA